MMDSSISHDPFAPDSTTFPDFRRARWQSAGATEAELLDLESVFTEQSLEVQIGEVRTIDTVGNGELSEALDRQRQTGEFVGFRPAPAAAPIPASSVPHHETGFHIETIFAGGKKIVRRVLGPAPETPKPVKAQAPIAEAVVPAPPLGEHAAPAGAPDNGETDAPATLAALERQATYGTWVRNAQPIDIDGHAFPIWDLANDWVGTRVGDEVDGMHLIAATREELIAKIQKEISR